MKRVLMLMTIAAGMTIGASGQAPPSPPAVVAQFLQLNDTQQAAFQKLLQNLQSTVSPFAQQAEARGQALDQALNAATPDPAAAGRLLLEIRAIQKQIQQTVAAYRQTFASMLAPEQQQKLQAVTQAAALVPAVQVFAASMLVDAPH